MTFQDVTHRLGTEGTPKIGEGSNNPIVALGAMLLRHAHHQGLQLWVNGGTPCGLTLYGTVKLLGHELAVPGEDGVGFDDGGDFFQRSLPQLLTDLGQGLALAIAEKLIAIVSLPLCTLWVMEGGHTLNDHK
jgi:hypothetical protein